MTKYLGRIVRTRSILSFQTSRGSGAPLEWKQLYRAAKLELDPTKLIQQVDDAYYAILDRIADHFSTKSSDEEQVEMRVALEALNFLRKRTICRNKKLPSLLRSLRSLR
jgi:hypothetical protein